MTPAQLDCQIGADAIARDASGRCSGVIAELAVLGVFKKLQEDTKQLQLFLSSTFNMRAWSAPVWQTEGTTGMGVFHRVLLEQQQALFIQLSTELSDSVGTLSAPHHQIISHPEMALVSKCDGKITPTVRFADNTDRNT